ncbi:MAG: hypothetical protein A3C35_05140 [Omnitrophica bacterium RIFCSPHIGHO2_02_FULL_46_11]|nr:MAG: hypothetical protein A3C35_05140 [Omnitrophica bacterium RIFCSPHIGHO2_02_FULL_46_11]
MKLNELKMNAMKNEPKNNESSMDAKSETLPGILLLFAGIAEAHRLNGKSNVSNQHNISPEVKNSHLHQCINCDFMFLCKIERCLVKSRTKTRFRICDACQKYIRLKKNLGPKEN